MPPKKNYVWPLHDIEPALPSSLGRFGVARRYDVHTGLDLYAPEGARVVAIESGRVVRVCDFTGPSAGCPWWLTTQAVMIEGPSGVILYGEIETKLFEGLDIPAGALIGHVKRVLRNDKGLPTSMLHLEFYDFGVRAPVESWPLDQLTSPMGLRDPLLLVEDHVKRATEALQASSD